MFLAFLSASPFEACMVNDKGVNVIWEWGRRRRPFKWIVRVEYCNVTEIEVYRFLTAMTLSPVTIPFVERPGWLQLFIRRQSQEIRICQQVKWKEMAGPRIVETRTFAVTEHGYGNPL